MVTALISGFLAKESLVATLQVLAVLALVVYAVGRLLKKDKCCGCKGCNSGKC